MSDADKNLLNNRYRIIGSLGQGGMGAVYHAIDESLGVEVAVKENKIDDEDYNRQFKLEANILANMRHPNLPRVTDHFVIDDGQYLVMDFVEGEDLRERLERTGPLPEKEAMLIGVAICDAISYLHTQDPPILHRDIKPGNIKVTPSGHVFLVDFGLAKVDQDGSQTTTGARGLTPGYSPPEQYGSARTDARSDVYALGGTLYALVTGDPPEDGLSIAINQSTLTPVTERKPSTSSKLAIVIEKALQIHADDRYQSAKDFKQALLSTSDTVQQKVAMGEMTIAPPPAQSFSSGVKEKTIALKEGTNWGLFGGLAGLLALLVVIGALVVPKMMGNAVEPTETFVVEATQAPAIVVEEPTETTVVEPTDEPAGPQVAYASDRSGDFQIWMMTLDTEEEPIQLTSISGGACQPDWSPDGTYLVFVSPCDSRKGPYEQGQLWLLNVAEEGEPEFISESAPGDFDPNWSPDGTRIAFTSYRENNSPRLFTLDFETHEVTRMVQPNTPNAQPYWSPDGAYIAFVLSNEIYVLEVGTNKAVPLTGNARVDTYPIWSPSGSTIVFTQSSPEYMQFVRWGGSLPLDPLNETRLVADAIPMRDPDFSKDGDLIIFSSNAGGDGTIHDLYKVFANGSGVEKITDDPYLNFQPAWRPTP